METSKLTTMIMGNFILELLQFIVESKFIPNFFSSYFHVFALFCGNEKKHPGIPAISWETETSQYSLANQQLFQAFGFFCGIVSLNVYTRFILRRRSTRLSGMSWLIREVKDCNLGKVSPFHRN